MNPIGANLNNPLAAQSQDTLLISALQNLLQGQQNLAATNMSSQQSLTEIGRALVEQGKAIQTILTQGTPAGIQAEGTPTVAGVIRTIDDIPGARNNQWYEVPIAFSYNSQSRTSGQVTINAEGPFIITQIQPYWQCLDDVNVVDNNGAVARLDLYGRIIPISGFQYHTQQLGNVTLGNLLVRIQDVPEFSLELQVQGSGRMWTQSPVTGQAFYGRFGPQVTAVMGWLDPTDQLTVYATPEKAVPHTGKIRVVLHGFQILRPVKLTELLSF